MVRCRQPGHKEETRGGGFGHFIKIAITTITIIKFMQRGKYQLGRMEEDAQEEIIYLTKVANLQKMVTIPSRLRQRNGTSNHLKVQ